VTPETRPAPAPPREAYGVKPQPVERLPKTGGLDMEMTFAALAGALLSLGGICIGVGGVARRSRPGL
jgi:hypothetical protein